MGNVGGRHVQLCWWWCSKGAGDCGCGGQTSVRLPMRKACSGRWALVPMRGRGGAGKSERGSGVLPGSMADSCCGAAQQAMRLCSFA
jgi:hypothetical protein